MPFELKSGAGSPEGTRGGLPAVWGMTDMVVGLRVKSCF